MLNRIFSPGVFRLGWFFAPLTLIILQLPSQSFSFVPRRIFDLVCFFLHEVKLRPTWCVPVCDLNNLFFLSFSSSFVSFSTIGNNKFLYGWKANDGTPEKTHLKIYVSRSFGWMDRVAGSVNMFYLVVSYLIFYVWFVSLAYLSIRCRLCNFSSFVVFPLRLSLFRSELLTLKNCIPFLKPHHKLHKTQGNTVNFCAKCV